ncbi:MAG: amidohydrolase family protein [Balneolaceae bacterium]|nr:amidohydrolase family protein [Balneolaceae bacterium]
MKEGSLPPGTGIFFDKHGMEISSICGITQILKTNDTMKIFKHIVSLCCMILFVAVAEAQITQKATAGKFAISGATIHTVSDGVITDGVVLIEGEEITFVGKNVKVTPDFERIDASGKHVYPGFMDAGTLLGLVEVEAVAVTNDQAELGEFNPHVRAFTAINPNSVAIPVTRVNGVTHVISLPVSGRIGGKAALIDLYGYTPDSMAVTANAALHLNWPSSYQSPYDDQPEEEVQKAYKENINQLNEYWEKAVFYDKMMTAYEENPNDKTQPDTDRKLEAMREVVTGEIPVIISVERKKDILNALEWIGEREDARFVSGGRPGRLESGQERLPMPACRVLFSTLYTPVRDSDNYQRPYQNPGILHEAGVKVAIATGSAENVRNAPYHAGFAATYGLGKEEALKAITINGAEIFGVEDRLGSLEEGKQANLFISDGDPFEPTSQIDAGV